VGCFPIPAGLAAVPTANAPIVDPTTKLQILVTG
jgi:hypothetical protein